MKKYLRNVALTVSLLTILLSGAMLQSEQGAFARGSKSIMDTATDLGTFLKDKPQLLSESLKTFNNQKLTIMPNEIARINELPITSDELNLREGYFTSLGYNVDKLTVFNSLAEDKIIIDFVKKHNIAPSEAEINEFISEQKANYNDSLEVKNTIDAFCKEAKMTQDDYWDKYLYYNVYGFLSFDKFSAYAVAQGIKDGKLPEEANYKQKVDCWNSYLLDLKANTSIQMNDQFKDLKLKLDNSKLYR